MRPNRLQTMPALFLAVAFSLSSFGQPPERKESDDHAVKSKFLDLSRRPVDGSKGMTGTIFFKSIDNESDWPFFRVEKGEVKSKEYKIETCDEACRREIEKCKGGERCEIRAEVREGNSPFIIAKTLRVLAHGETKATKRGHVFTYDTSYAKLGEAWRDPSGMVWSDIAKDDKGEARTMNHAAASEYCKSIGGALPSREDFERLRESMGAISRESEGYSPQVLPNLTYYLSETTIGYWFWSSTVDPQNSTSAYGFDGGSGAIYEVIRSSGRAVRCVVARR